MTGQWKLVPTDFPFETVERVFERTRYDAGFCTHRGLVSAIIDAAPSVPEDVLELMARAHWESRRTGFSVPRLGLHEVVNWSDLPADFRNKEIAATRAALSAAQHSTQGEG